jgi:hypothetical protein
VKKWTEDAIPWTAPSLHMRIPHIQHSHKKVTPDKVPMYILSHPNSCLTGHWISKQSRIYEVAFLVPPRSISKASGRHRCTCCPLLPTSFLRGLPHAKQSPSWGWKPSPNWGHKSPHRRLHRTWRSWGHLSAWWERPDVNVSGVSEEGPGHGVSIMFDWWWCPLSPVCPDPGTASEIWT